MIKSNELREGNYVNVVGKNSFNITGIIQVEDIISGCGINMHHDSFAHKLKDIQPIPLTEEWLIKFGFDPCYFADGGKLSFYRINDSNFLLPDFTLVWFGTKIKYVHQLQNLYFALTGEELKTDTLPE